MKIAETKEIKEYLARLKENIESNYQNDFLDGYIEPKDEKEAKNELLLAGQQEFNKENSPSLYIDSDEWENNPYIKNINFSNINKKHYRYENVLIEKNYLFNADSIMDDEDRELKDWLKLRALSKDIEAPFLYQDDSEWMMAVPSEAYTNDPYALKAHGNVLTFGLGIGYFTYMALLNKNVKSVTVIEKSKEVIELFEEIKNQFPNKDNIKIINGDAFDYFNESFINNYDYVYVDIWQSTDDGRKIIEKLLSQYNPPLDKVDFWIEKSCLNVIRTLIYMYYDETVKHKLNKTTKDYHSLMDKVRLYFNNIDKEIKTVNELKDIMYDTKVIRDILAMR